MKVSEATGENDKIIYFDIRTDRGTRIGSCIPNLNPLGEDSEITLIECKEYATLWAAADDLLEALESMSIEFSRPDYELFCDHGVGICSCVPLGIIEKAKEAIKKARGL